MTAYTNNFMMKKEQTKNQLFEDMRAEIDMLRAQVQSYEYAFQYKKEAPEKGIVMDCKEKEFYEGEIKDLVLEILEEEKKKMDQDPNQIGWRKYHILSSILESNTVVGKRRTLRNELKAVLSRIGRPSAKDRKMLNDLGFVVRQNGHNKLYFHDDDRYFITLASTPSDKGHASKNAAAIAIKTIVS